MINQYKAGWKRKLLRESWTEGMNRFCEKELAHDTTWQGCSGFNFKHVTTSSTPYYRLSHIIVKNMLIQMWSKCEVRGDQGKAESIVSTTESSVVYRWFFHQTPHSNFTGSTCLRLTHEDTNNPHCLPPLQENVVFLSHKKSHSSSPMWEVNFVVSSIIKMYNMWCLLWHILN
jgi:hypothetical protein